jgi:hypothetical protein
VYPCADNEMIPPPAHCCLASPVQVVLLPEHSSGALLLGIDSAALTIHRWAPPLLLPTTGTTPSAGAGAGGRRLKLQLDGLQVGNWEQDRMCALRTRAASASLPHPCPAL